MEKFTTLTSRILPLPVDDIDTDQIVPARYLKTTSRKGLADALFANWRYKKDGSPDPNFVLHKPEYQGAEVLLGGQNFGCGSSREHAPWALVESGFRAVIAHDFADIFKSNALKNGLLPIAIPADAHAELLSWVEGDAKVEVRIDLERQILSLPSGREIGFPIDSFSRHCLLEGRDSLEYLLGFDAEIALYEAQRQA